MKPWKTLFVATMLAAFASALTACNTMEGAGQDIEEGGEAVQDVAN